MSAARDLTRAIERDLKRLATLQARDGSFPSLCSPDPKRFARAEERRTVFPAALALWSLSHVEGSSTRKAAQAILRKAARFVESQAGPDGTWNYMARGSADAKRRPYPDDLDDTACALAGLDAARRAVGAGAPDDEGKRLAAFVNALIATETAEGGPYRTWVTAPAKGWDDVDPAVNASVALFLGSQGVRLAPLDAFLDRCAKKPTASLYYHSDITVSYFLARALEQRAAAADDADRAAAAEAAKAVVKRVSKARLAHALDAALAASTLLRLGAPTPAVDKALDVLVSKRLPDGRWPACPFYIEEIKGSATGSRKAKKAYYAGSEAVTTLFAIEALSLCQRPSGVVQGPSKPVSDEAVVTPVRTLASAFVSGLPEPLRPGAEAALARIREKGLEAFIALLPHGFAGAAGIKNLEKGSLDRLGLANLLGWAGYTIQDDVVDDGRGTELVPLSNALIRESLRLIEAEAGTGEGRAYVRSVFDRIDAANAGEAANPIALSSLESLADKSFGHALGPIVVAHRSGVAVGSAQFRALEEFFVSYIAARQLSDDAHDWEADLRSGRANPAVAPLFMDLVESGESGLPPTEETVARLRKLFWEKRILEVVADVRRLCAEARAAAKRSGIVPEAFADRALAPLERSAGTAESERRKTLDFIRSFENKG